MIEKTIYIYTTQRAHGIVVIVDHLIDAFKRKGINCKSIDNLKHRTYSDFIIPYGVKEANDVIDSGLRTEIVFAADAITLGYINKVKFYLRKFHIFNFDFLYSIFAYLKYSNKEKRMLNSFAKCILVSPVDIEYFNKRFNIGIEKFIYAPNGIELPVSNNVVREAQRQKLTLGILSPWKSKQITEESKWFINKFFKRYAQSHDDVKLILAGRGNRISQFEGIKGVNVMGEVDSLNEFFGSIDILISSNPKGCGILNRVLDGFSYGVPVAGVPGSFTGFPKAQNCYFTFSTFKEFCELMDNLKSDNNLAHEMSLNATEYIHVNHNWVVNYDNLVNSIIKLYPNF